MIFKSFFFCFPAQNKTILKKEEALNQLEIRFKSHIIFFLSFFKFFQPKSK